MSREPTREAAAAILLERALPDLEAFAAIPPYLRARAARRAAVQLLAEATRLSPLEQGALVHAATTDADAQVRVSAVAALSRLAASLAIPVLIACSADRDEAVRGAASQGLARLESAEARVVELVRSSSVPTEPLRVPRFIGH